MSSPFNLKQVLKVYHTRLLEILGSDLDSVLLYGSQACSKAGDSFKRLIERVAKVYEISPKELLSGGKHSKTVKARSVVCYWGNRELGMSTIELSKKMNISQTTASQSVVRDQKNSSR